MDDTTPVARSLHARPGPTGTTLIAPLYTPPQLPRSTLVPFKQSSYLSARCCSLLQESPSGSRPSVPRTLCTPSCLVCSGSSSSALSSNMAAALVAHRPAFMAPAPQPYAAAPPMPVEWTTTFARPIGGAIPGRPAASQAAARKPRNGCRHCVACSSRIYQHMHTTR